MFKDDRTRVAIYTRVSTSMQVDKDSLPMQKADLEAYAKLILHADETAIYTDAGYSGKNTARPDFQRMMTDVRNGLFTHVLVWKIDRISRNLLDFAAMYAELKKLGVVFVSKSEQFDTSSAMGEAMLKIILVFAELERNMTSERVTATMISRAAGGQWNGGKIPYGYDYDFQNRIFSVNPVEGPVVEHIFETYLKTRSLVRTAVTMNAEGFRTKSGAEFSAVTCGAILRSPFYAGDYRYNMRREGGSRFEKKSKSEWVIVPDHHPAIIDRRTQDTVIAILAEQRRLLLNRGMYAEGSRNVHVFGGLVYCGACGQQMTSHTGNAKRDGWRYSKYLCPTRRKHTTLCKSIADARLGEFVLNLIVRILNLKKNRPANIESLRSALTSGATFERISEIGADGLAALFDAIYAPGTNVFNAKKPSKTQGRQSEHARIRAEKQKLDRAAERLKHLYLYADSGMSDAEYIAQKAEIDAAMADLDSRMADLGVAVPGELDDEQFVSIASRFILQKRISGRAYANYKTLAQSVDPAELQAFFRSIVSQITIINGEVSSVAFRNGVVLDFTYDDKKPAD